MKQDIINRSMITAAREAGTILKQAFDANSTEEISKHKGYYDVVSKADIESEKTIIKIIEEKLPEVNILSEEKGLISKNSEDTIIIDPLDGSSNFLLGLPHFSVALAHLHSGEVIAAVIYNPILKKMYFAEKGKGVSLNSKMVLGRTKKDLSYVAINFSHKDTWVEKRKAYDYLYTSSVKRILNNWSPNLDFCLLAEGKIEAVISRDSLIFDFAPGLLVAKEAGYIDFPTIKKIDAGADTSMTFIIGSKTLPLEKLLCRP